MTEESPAHLIRKDGNPRARRMAPEQRKAQIVAQGVILARQIGIKEVTRNEVARLADISFGLVNRYFKSLGSLKTAIRKRIKEEIAASPVTPPQA
jgi:DNA-binding transcriptional regulator YbjK